MSTVLAACTNGAGGSGQTGGERTLRIGILDGDSTNDWVRQNYTDAYELMQGGRVKVEIVPANNYNDERYKERDEDEVYDPTENYRKLVDLLDSDNPVDVVLLDNGDLNLLRQLVRDNLLKPLDPLITEKKFDISDFSPVVVEGIKQAGDNNLYALAPQYSTSGLFFNKKIFQDQGLEPPHDGMTWQEIFDLARQVTNGEGADRVFGFAGTQWGAPEAYWVTQNYAGQLQMRLYDAKADVMTINTPQWEKVFNDLYALYEEKIWPDSAETYANEDPNWNRYDLFNQGRLAMMIDDYSYVNNLQNQQKGVLLAPDKGPAPLDWDVVTVPQHPEAPDIGFGVSLQGLVAINAKATNVEDAWEYLAFINGKQWAQMKSRSSYTLVSRMSLQAQDAQTFNLQAFNTLKPIPPASVDQRQLDKDRPGLYMVDGAGNDPFYKVQQGEMTIKEALAEWDTVGNDMLRRMQEDPDWVMKWYEEQNGGPLGDGGFAR
jgi:multiple sugar transport system substrate-binding protein